jgi:hypothetical protein
MRLHIAVIGIFICVVTCTAGDGHAPIEALGIVHAIHRNADWALRFIQGAFGGLLDEFETERNCD